VPRPTLVGVLCTARVSGQAPYAQNDAITLRKSIALNSSTFSVTTQLEAADYILVAGSGTRFYSDLRRSAMYRRHRRKIFVLDFSDLPIPVTPGLYACLSDAPDVALYKGCSYPRVARVQALNVTGDPAPSFLAWFRGDVASHPIRRRVVALNHPRFSVGHRNTGLTTEPTYARDLRSGKFILCPRGKGVSTFRIFEAMRLGRVPVVISDEWIEPPNCEWSGCHIRVAERDIERLPEILKEREADWPRMSAAAHSNWNAHFSTKALMPWIDLAIRQIAAARGDNDREPGFFRVCRDAARRQLLPHWLREAQRVRTGGTTTFMAPESEWVLGPEYPAYANPIGDDAVGSKPMTSG
jgi:hypothetical protein